jgi:general secretion pathway protein G
MLKRNRAFTLIETLIVVTLLAMIASIAIATHKNSTRKARETVLRHNLQNLRTTLDQYNNDKGRYPDSLQVLADEGYLREIPIDPITKSRETWQEEFEQDYADEDSSYEPGVFDVHSGSEETAIDGTVYYEW